MGQVRTRRETMLDKERARFRQQIRGVEHELVEVKAACYDLQQEVTNKEEEIAKLQSEIEELKQKEIEKAKEHERMIMRSSGIVPGGRDQTIRELANLFRR